MVDSKRRIAWVAYDSDNTYGGPIINAVRLLPELSKRGYQVHAIIGSKSDNSPNADLLEMKGVKCSRYRIPQFSVDHTRVLLKLAAEIRPHVFVSNISAQAGFAGRYLRSAGIPVVHTLRSDDDLNLGMARFFFSGSVEWSLDSLVSVNQYLLNKLQLRPGILSRVIPSGVPIPQQISNQQGGRLNVVYAGRIVQKQKRIRETIEAFITVSQRSENVDFTVIGQGKEELLIDLRSKVDRFGLSDRIRFKSPLFDQEYKSFLAKNEIIVLLSDYEGTPGALLDGMSCGLIPVSLSINGIDELVIHGKNGILVNDRKDEFLQALLSLVPQVEERKVLSQRARQTIMDDYSLEGTVEKWSQLIEDLIDNEPKPVIVPSRIKLPEESQLLLEHHNKPSLTDRFFKKMNSIAGS